MRSLAIMILFLGFLIAACHPARESTSEKKPGPSVAQTITDIHWRLIELDGQEVTVSENHLQEAYLVLHSADKRATGNGSCNNFNGSYELGDQNRISFSPMMSTRMACPEMQVEDRLMKVFESVDNYTLKEDTLSLNRARMAPLARFVALPVE